MTNRKSFKPYLIRAIIFICIALVIIFAIWLDIPRGIQEIIFGNKNIQSDFGQNESLDIAFIDVGQGDSTIIGSQGNFVLIDAGDNDMGRKVLRKLDKLGIKKIDTLILTHPHADHIGGADDVLNGISVGIIYMPDVIHNTMTFENLLNAAEYNNVKIMIPDVGNMLEYNGFELLFLHPDDNKMFEEINDYSIMVKVSNEFGSAVFTGDGERQAEYDVLNTGFNIKADILKVGHHGSVTSTSKNFLRAINPDYAVISCGENNDYGHPHDETMASLMEENIKIYITYQNGTVYFSIGEDGVGVVTE